MNNCSVSGIKFFRTFKEFASLLKISIGPMHVSPEFQVMNVPEGTKRLTFWMTDLNAPSDFHGGGEVDYTGPVVPKDAFAKSGQAVLLSNKYVGPCSTAPHNYQFEVNAIDGGGNYVGTGKATRPYPP